MKSKNLHVGKGPPWLSFIPAGLWAAVLFALSSVPGSEYPTVRFPHADKVVHFGVYAVLGAACAWALARTTALHARALVLAAAAMATAYGVTDEIHQLFVPRRSADWRDLVADAAGALCGAAVVAWWHHARSPTDR